MCDDKIPIYIYIYIYRHLASVNHNVLLLLRKVYDNAISKQFMAMTNIWSGFVAIYL